MRCVWVKGEIWWVGVQPRMNGTPPMSTWAGRIPGNAVSINGTGPMAGMKLICGGAIRLICGGISGKDTGYGTGTGNGNPRNGITTGCTGICIDVSG